MRPNKLRELLTAGKPTIGTHIHTTWPSIVEAKGSSPQDLSDKPQRRNGKWQLL
jgi:hypothetical protein